MAKSTGPVRPWPVARDARPGDLEHGDLEHGDIDPGDPTRRPDPATRATGIARHGARFLGTDSGTENGGRPGFFRDSGPSGGPAAAPALFRVNNHGKNDIA